MNIIKWIFIANIIALIIGTILNQRGHSKAARILYYIMFAGFATCLIIAAILLIPYFAR